MDSSMNECGQDSQIDIYISGQVEDEWMMIGRL